jgi:hypothetical protein
MMPSKSRYNWRKNISDKEAARRFWPILRQLMQCRF